MGLTKKDRHRGWTHYPAYATPCRGSDRIRSEWASIAVLMAFARILTILSGVGAVLHRCLYWSVLIAIVFPHTGHSVFSLMTCRYVFIRESVLTVGFLLGTHIGIDGLGCFRVYQVKPLHSHTPGILSSATPECPEPL
jgi:hypothetical protein